MMEKSLQRLDEFLLTLRIQNHDYKHHIHHIENQIQTAEDLSSLRSQVHTYIQQIDTDRSFFSILQGLEQPLFRSVLFGAYQRCQKEHIDFQLNCSSLLPVFPLKDYQLVEVLENLISNAVEQNCVLPEKQRFLTITLFSDGFTNECAITNPLEVDYSLMKNIDLPGRTSKGGSHQGLGLTSTKQILNLYALPLYQKYDADNNTITFSFTYQHARKESEHASNCVN